MKIAQGAEAILYAYGDIIRKERPEKAYRIPEIDQTLRKQRTNRERKVLQKLAKAGIAVPKVVSHDDTSICMQNIAGKQLKHIIEEKPELGRKWGVMVAKVHEQGIIHGDLTTSNILVNKDLTLIDFGLSFFSHKTEHRAVDLHVLHQCLQSSHHHHAAKIMQSFLKGYQALPEAKEVLARLATVEQRGRYKKKSYFLSPTKPPAFSTAPY